MTLLWVLIPALTTVVEAGLDMAGRCTRNTDETGIILIARYVESGPSLCCPKIGSDVWLYHCLIKNEGCNVMVTLSEASYKC